jgi:2-dehydro-3-deoxy-D-arabinonate dehydratase
MKLAQVRASSTGVLSAAIVHESGYRLIIGHTVASLIRKAEAEGADLADLAEEMALVDPVTMELAIPVTPAEVWACGCSYAPSAEFRDGEVGDGDGPYAYVADPAHRPELFFKGTERVCVGPNEKIGIRPDSTFTAPEPELALVVNSKGEVVGYSLGNDVSAWDIERENALYLPQSKVYDACCALGPFLVTPDEIEDPYQLEMTCTIHRRGQLTFEGKASVGQLRRKFEELVEYLTRGNSVPTPTVLLTGTGIIVTQQAALTPGDVVTIDVPGLGSLANEAVRV